MGVGFVGVYFAGGYPGSVHTFDKPVANLVPLWSQSGHQCELVARLQDAVADGYFVVDLPVR